MVIKVHPTAEVEEGAYIGDETSIWHHSHIRKGSYVGERCNLGKNVYIDKGVKIGREVKIQNNVSVYNGVIIEDGFFLGPSVVFTNDLYPRSHIWNEERLQSTIIKSGATIGAIRRGRGLRTRGRAPRTMPVGGAWFWYCPKFQLYRRQRGVSTWIWIIPKVPVYSRRRR